MYWYHYYRHWATAWIICRIDTCLAVQCCSSINVHLYDNETLTATWCWFMHHGSSVLGAVLIIFGLVLVSWAREEATRLAALARIVEQSGRLSRVAAEARDPELRAPLLQVNLLLLILFIPLYELPCFESLKGRNGRTPASFYEVGLNQKWRHFRLALVVLSLMSELVEVYEIFEGTLFNSTS